MNFVVIVSDTLRRDHLSCYGNNWISTPNISRFAKKSHVFDRAYSGSFPTVPHRRDLLTGRFTASYTGWAPLSHDEVVLPQVLSDAGYVTMMICDCPHILENGYNYDRGFDGWEWIRGQESDRWKTYPETPEHPCSPEKIREPERLQRLHRRNVADWRREKDRFVARTMSTACDWLEDNYKHEKFFLYVDTFDPHEPWDAPQWYVDMYDPGYKGEVIDYPRYAYTDFLTKSELKHCRALYAAEVTLVDRWVGRLFDKIEDIGLLKNTAVIFTTDHGFLHGEHNIIGKSLIEKNKSSQIPLYEEINHIPFIVFMPNTSPSRNEAIVQPMDIMPTILDIAKVDIPKTVHGKSFSRVLEGKKKFHRKYAISVHFVGSPSAVATVIKDNWTAILHTNSKNAKELIDMSVDGYKKIDKVRTDTKDMLFDIKKDPKQQNDLAEKFPKIIHKSRDILVKFFKGIKTSDDVVKKWEEG